MIKTLRNQIRVLIAVVGLSAASSHAAVLINQTGTNSLWDGITTQFVHYYSIMGILSDTSANGNFYYGEDDGFFFWRSTYGGLPAAKSSSNNVYFSSGSTGTAGAVVGSDNWLYVQSDAGNFGWVQVNLNFTDPVASSILQYAYDNTGAGLSLADARSALSPVPEPSTVFTLAGGLLALAVWRGVRKQAVSA